MTFGSYLHRQRRARGLTRTAFAASVTLSPAALADLEHHRVPPSYQDLRRMAEALRLPEQVLLVQAGYVSINALTPEERQCAALTDLAGSDVPPSLEAVRHAAAKAQVPEQELLARGFQQTSADRPRRISPAGVSRAGSRARSR